MSATQKSTLLNFDYENEQMRSRYYEWRDPLNKRDGTRKTKCWKCAQYIFTLPGSVLPLLSLPTLYLLPSRAPVYPCRMIDHLEIWSCVLGPPVTGSRNITFPIAPIS